MTTTRVTRSQVTRLLDNGPRLTHLFFMHYQDASGMHQDISLSWKGVIISL